MDLEVSPHLARDTGGPCREGLMIKLSATREAFRRSAIAAGRCDGYRRIRTGSPRCWKKYREATLVALRTRIRPA